MADDFPHRGLLAWLLTWVTWVNYPSSPSGRDLNLSLKASSDGELTTASAVGCSKS